ESTTAEAEPELVAPPEPETVIAETRAESAETDAAVSGESVEPSSVEPVAASPATASTAAVTESQTPAPATAESVPASSNDAPSETDTAKTDPAPTQAELAAIKQQRETPELVDRRTDAELKRLLSRGRLAEAEDRLAAVLASQPAPLSRARLARHLIIANEPARALALLPESVTANHPELRLLKARAHLALGNADQALAALEESVPPVSQNPEYLVTLAALLQQEGRHNDAVGRWAELVAYNDSQAAWWVGLASALEADQQTGGALRAYRQALALSDLSPTLADFCRQRLRALGAG
ncbi:MAG: MSHA biogenesis protein MshN, partial [Marinobacter sp.]|uniref:tetratricopeptide repeat protein n=1 Tax=Marinobacter sp. TaxID=50741 RepID=UPI00299D1EE9